MMIQAATAMGYALSSVFNHATTAVAFAPIVNMPLNLLGGYMISLKNIFQQSPQRYIAWLEYVSPVRYGFTALCVLQFPINDTPETKKNTDKFLKDYGFQDKSYWECFGMLVLLFIVFRALVVVSLACQDRSKTKGMTDNRNQEIKKPQRPIIGEFAASKELGFPRTKQRTALAASPSPATEEVEQEDDMQQKLLPSE